MRGRRAACAGLRPDGAILDPGFDVGDFGIFEAAGGRHFEASVGVVESLDHEAGGGIARDDDGAGFAAFERVFGGVELEAAHVFVGVAGVAVVGEEGTDAHFEELFVGLTCAKAGAMERKAKMASVGRGRTGSFPNWALNDTVSEKRGVRAGLVVKVGFSVVAVNLELEGPRHEFGFRFGLFGGFGCREDFGAKGFEPEDGGGDVFARGGHFVERAEDGLFGVPGGGGDFGAAGVAQFFWSDAEEG